MAWYHQATSCYVSQYWPRSMLPYDVTRPQWVNAKVFTGHIMQCTVSPILTIAHYTCILIMNKTVSWYTRTIVMAGLLMCKLFTYRIQQSGPLRIIVLVLSQKQLSGPCVCMILLLTVLILHESAVGLQSSVVAMINDCSYRSTAPCSNHA